MSEKLLRLPEVKGRTGLCTTDIYAGMKAGTFPKSVPIGERSVAWVESEVAAWIAARVKARDTGAPRHVGGPGRGHRVTPNQLVAQA